MMLYPHVRTGMKAELRKTGSILAVESVSAEGNIGTVITNIRALGFSAATGAWVETHFSLGK